MRFDAEGGPCEKLRLDELIAHIGGPAVATADDAPDLDRIVAASGRDPDWRGR